MTEIIGTLIIIGIVIKVIEKFVNAITNIPIFYKKDYSDNYRNSFSLDTPPSELEKNKDYEKFIGVECPENSCKGMIVEKISIEGKIYYRCSKYPTCNFVVFDLPVGVYCPQDDCGGLILEKESKAGRRFYGCSNFPKCRFTTRLKPVSFGCPGCGANFLVEKESYEDGLLYSCVSCGYNDIAENFYN